MLDDLYEPPIEDETRELRSIISPFEWTRRVIAGGFAGVAGGFVIGSLLFQNSWHSNGVDPVFVVMLLGAAGGMMFEAQRLRHFEFGRVPLAQSGNDRLARYPRQRTFAWRLGRFVRNTFLVRRTPSR